VINRYVSLRYGSMGQYRKRQAEALLNTVGRTAVFGEHVEWGDADTGGMQPTGIYLADGRGLVLQAIGNPALVDQEHAGLVYAAKGGKDSLVLKTHVVLDQLTQIGQAFRDDPDHVSFGKFVIPVRMERMFGPFRQAVGGAVDFLNNIDELGLQEINLPKDWLDADRDAAKGCVILYRGITPNKAAELVERLQAIAPPTTTPVAVENAQTPAEFVRRLRTTPSLIVTNAVGAIAEKQFEAAVRGKVLGHEVTGAIRRTRRFYRP
jgi:hypothetical protein